MLIFISIKILFQRISGYLRSVRKEYIYKKTGMRAIIKIQVMQKQMSLRLFSISIH